MTRNERRYDLAKMFAAEFLHMVTPGTEIPESDLAKVFAKESVIYADALIEALEMEPTTPTIQETTPLPVAAILADVSVVLDGFEKGIFIRDTSHDNELGWTINLLPYIVAMARLFDAVDNNIQIKKVEP